jgi:acetyltransferase-like isoleucine patch superfamily enzyme
VVRAVRLPDRFEARRTARRWEKVRRAALTPPPPRAFASFGRSFILPPARIANPQWIHIGDDVTIHEEVWLAVEQGHPDVVPALRIDDGCRIGRGTQISCAGQIHIERGVVVSDQVQIGDTSHAYADPTTPVIDQGMLPAVPVRIGAGALIGCGAVVLPGVTIGAGAYVAEGSVVTGDVPARAVLEGNPGVVVGSSGR